MKFDIGRIIENVIIIGILLTLHILITNFLYN
jgi:hypothetical protein